MWNQPISATPITLWARSAYSLNLKKMWIPTHTVGSIPEVASKTTSQWFTRTPPHTRKMTSRTSSSRLDWTTGLSKTSTTLWPSKMKDKKPSMTKTMPRLPTQPLRNPRIRSRGRNRNFLTRQPTERSSPKDFTFSIEFSYSSEGCHSSWQLWALEFWFTPWYSLSRKIGVRRDKVLSGDKWVVINKCIVRTSTSLMTMDNLLDE